MSDDEEYEYDDDDGDNMEEDNEFEYTDNEEEQDDAAVELENAYYNAKSLRETTSTAEAAAALEQVIVQEQELLQKEGKQYGPWSYKAMKQLVKLHLRSGNNAQRGGDDGDDDDDDDEAPVDPEIIMKHYRRLLECISSTNSDVSPAAVEKGINGMLERVASHNSGGGRCGRPQQALALAVYDATLAVFHPQTGPCKNERLWFKTNLKYGQLLYEMNETSKLQAVLKDLLQIHELDGNNNNATSAGGGGGGGSNSNASGSTNRMEIYALQIQLYSRLKDNKKLREIFHKAMNVRGGIPHPRTIALIQGTSSTEFDETYAIGILLSHFLTLPIKITELGGKMHMSHADYEEAGKTFFQAFKSYDEAGDQSRLRCIWSWRRCCMRAASIRLIRKKRVPIAMIPRLSS
jgi:COP9 signalosome complex subunit 2